MRFGGFSTAVRSEIRPARFEGEAKRSLKTTSRVGSRVLRLDGMMARVLGSRALVVHSFDR
jgi:hypothetical protein